jgi:pilus assembly protein CpaF
MARPLPVVPLAPYVAPLGRKQCAEPPIRPSLPHSVALENQAALLGLLREDFDTACLWRRGVAPDNERARAERSLQGALQRYSQERRIPVGINQQTLLQDALEEAVHLGPLAKLLADENIAEILVNGPHQIISSLVSGEERVEPFGFATERGLVSAIERLLRASGRDLPADADTLDARLHDGTRLLAIFPPSAAQGTVLRIQRPLPAPFTLQELVEREVLSPQVAEFLDICVRSGRSVVVVGGASSGRGILLGALSNSIPDTEPLALLTPGAGLSLPMRRVMYFDPSARGVSLVARALGLGASRVLARDLPLVALGEFLRDAAARPVSVLASLCAHGTQDALGRLAAALRCTSPEGDEESLQALLGRAVSLIVYIDRGPRVVQVSEVLPLQDGDAEIACLDLFLASGEQLLPTREQPSFWADLVLRGEADGTSLFE